MLPGCLAASQVLPSTASGTKVSKRSWELDASGLPLQGAGGELVRPHNNEPKLNILLQFLVLIGIANGSSRSFEPAALGQLLMQPRAALMGVLSRAVETDGSRHTRVSWPCRCSFWHVPELCGQVCVCPTPHPDLLPLHYWQPHTHQLASIGYCPPHLPAAGQKADHHPRRQLRA